MALSHEQVVEGALSDISDQLQALNDHLSTLVELIRDQTNSKVTMVAGMIEELNDDLRPLLEQIAAKD